MAHEVEKMFFVGETPWHGLGVPLKAPPTVRDAIVLAGLDWTVRTEPVQLRDGRQLPALATIRESDDSVLGVVGPTYRPLQNVDAFDWFQPFLESGEVELEAAGSLRDGQRIWILARIKRDPIQVAKGDDILQYLLLSNGHDGKLACRVGFTPIRVVCANTLRMSHESKTAKLIRVFHRGDVADSLERVRDTVNIAARAFEATAEQYRQLASCAIAPQDLERYVQRVFRVQGVAEPSAETKRPGQRILDNVLPLFEKGRGNDLPAVRGTWWAAYNAVTEYLAWERGTSEAADRLNSLWFGQNGHLNQRALDVALEMAA